MLALQLDMYSNAGNSLDLSTSIMDRALVHCDCACALRKGLKPLYLLVVVDYIYCACLPCHVLVVPACDG